MAPSLGSVLVIDDEEIIREAFEALLGGEGYQVSTAETAKQGFDMVADGDADIVLLDIMLPGRSGLDVLEDIRRLDDELPVVMITAFGTIESAVAATKQGAFYYFTKPFKNDDVLVVLRNAIERRQLVKENRELRSRLRSGSHRLDEIIGGSPKMKSVYDLIHRAAPSRTTVLIEGESGTGKELVARAFHRYSARSDNSFVTVNSGNLPPDLLESNLFGHVKGAFTGAVYPKKGLFELADKGTIFFDGSATSARHAGQAASGDSGTRVHAAGASTIRSTSASWPRPMSACGDGGAGRFREDLFYRLNVITSSCRRSCHARTIFRCSCSASSTSTEESHKGGLIWRPRRWIGSWRITGRATCASWRT